MTAAEALADLECDRDRLERWMGEREKSTGGMTNEEWLAWDAALTAMARLLDVLRRTKT